MGRDGVSAAAAAASLAVLIAYFALKRRKRADRTEGDQCSDDRDAISSLNALHFRNERVVEAGVEENSAVNQQDVGAGRERAVKEISRKSAAQEREARGYRGKTASGVGLPDGQSLVREWIVMDLGSRPPESWRGPWRHGGGKWRLSVECDGAETLSVSLRTIRKLGVRTYDVDWHCVTGWSFYGLKLQGVPLDSFITEICKPPAGWTSLMQISADGYTANVHREDAIGSGAFIALSDESGKPLPVDHGGVRIVFPTLYGWKSAKFLSGIRFDDAPTLGFWEKLGCHPRGRWAYSERWAPRARGVWVVLAHITDQYRVWLGYGTWVSVMKNGGRALGALVWSVAYVSGIATFYARQPRAKEALEDDDESEGRSAADPRPLARHVKDAIGGVGKVRLREELDKVLVESLEKAFSGGILDARYEMVLRPGGSECLREGITVLVEGKKGGRAKLECLCVEEGPFKGKSRVVYPKGAVYHASPKHLMPVESGRKVIVVPTTENYHSMAKSQVCIGDRVFEVGCDFGQATRVIADAGAAHVCAVDLSREHVAAAAAEHNREGVKFEVLDALCDMDGLARLGGGCNKVFVDINGNREIDAVIRCVGNVQRVIGPDVVVVKSIAVARAVSLMAMKQRNASPNGPAGPQ